MVPVGSSHFTVSNRALGPHPGPPVVWLVGEHDISTDDALCRTLAGAIALDAPALVVDLSELEFLGASTLGAIVRAREFIRLRSGSLTVRSAPPFARRIIDICGLNDLLGPSVNGAGHTAGTAPGSWVAAPPAERSVGSRGPSATAPTRLAARAHPPITLTARAAGAERLTENA